MNGEWKLKFLSSAEDEDGYLFEMPLPAGTPLPRIGDFVSYPVENGKPGDFQVVSDVYICYAEQVVTILIGEA